jgi:hypothetical protein
MGLHISDIQKNYNEGKYSISYYSEFQELLNLTKLSKDHVFDENLSVKRNREMVEEHNARVEAEKKEAYAKQAELDKKLTHDVCCYITENYDISYELAAKIQQFCYTEKHHDMYAYFDYIDTIAEFVDDILD